MTRRGGRAARQAGEGGLEAKEVFPRRRERRKVLGARAAAPGCCPRRLLVFSVSRDRCN